MQADTNPHRASRRAQHYLSLNARRADWSGVLIVAAVLAAVFAVWLFT